MFESACRLLWRNEPTMYPVFMDLQNLGYKSIDFHKVAAVGVTSWKATRLQFNASPGGP